MTELPPSNRKLVVVSGLSGAGKTVALKQYEDFGWYCIDNIPLMLMGALSTRLNTERAGARYERLALGIDARESAAEIARFPNHLRKLRERGVEVRVVFLTASDEVILRRYGETRRKHPLADQNTSLLEAIELERQLLAPIADLADDPIDTSGMNLHELREAIHVRSPEAVAGKLTLLLLSFGFKHGVPDGCDFVFDVRCLPNPHWDPQLKRLSGRDQAVCQWFAKHAAVDSMVQDLRQFLDRWLPAFRVQDRPYVTVGIGCTGGQHRSVYVVETLAAFFQERLDGVIVRHKELAA